MDELNGFGDDLPWLPRSVIRAREIETRAEDRQAREDERARADRRDQLHERAMAASRAELMASGEDVSAMAMVTGEGLGRTASDVLQMAAAAADRQDARESHRNQVRGTADAPEWIGSGDVVLARMAKPLSRRALYTKRLLDKFTGTTRTPM
jgi:hypothetical protein